MKHQITPSVFKEMIIERIPFYASENLSFDFLEADVAVAVDLAAAKLVAAYKVDMWGEKQHEYSETREVPSTWWQHFKQTKFPRWLLHRYPVKTYEIVTLTKKYYGGLCPHVSSEPFAKHAQFIHAPLLEESL
jgi:hypothetical protein